MAEIPFQYGDDLDTSLVPEAPKQGEEYGQWPQFPTQDLRRSMVLSVQFTTPTSTLADQDGVAQLLVEGTFSPDASLTVDQEELPDQKVEAIPPAPPGATRSLEASRIPSPCACGRKE